jgi:tetratricopeptide (TPR) repeat protein
MPGLLLCVLLLFVGHDSPGSRAHRSMGILVADFINETETPGLGARLDAVLRFSLQDSPDLKLYPQQELQDSLRQMVLNPFAPLTSGVAKSICQRENLPGFLLPRVNTNDGGYIATVQLVEVKKSASGESWVDMVRAGDETALVFAVEDMARKIRLKFGEDAGRLLANRKPLFLGGAGVSRALQLFASADTANSRGDIAEAIRGFEAALSLAPDFALAHQQLASLYATIGWTVPALDHAGAAKKLSASLPRRNQLLVSGAYAALRQDYSAALQAYRQLAGLYPNSWESYVLFGDAAIASGDIRGGVIAYQHACTITTSQPEPPLRLCAGQLSAGNVEEARKALERASGLAPEKPEIAVAAGWVELADGNPAAAARYFLKAGTAADPVLRSRGRLMQAQAELFSGRIRSALQALQTGMEADRQLGYPILEADKRLTRASIFLLAGDKAAAQSECRLLPTLDGDAVRLLCLGSILARSGDVESAAEVADRIAKIGSTSLAAYYSTLVRGEIGLSSGRVEDAIGLGEAAAKMRPGATARELLARAFMMAGHLDRAEAEYRALSERRGEVLFPADRVWFAGKWPEILFGHADCLRRLGRNQEARQQFRSYLWIFDGADPEIPWLAEARSFLRKPL